MSFIDSRISKWILGFATLFSMAWALFEHFHEGNPKLVYEIVSQVEAFNKTEDLSSIQVMVDSVNVLKEDENVSTLFVKIQNIGEKHLRRSDYDEGAFGIIIKSGRLFQEVVFIDASTPHIEERFHESMPFYSDQVLEIPRIALDRGEWYTFSFSVIHKDSDVPTIVPVGKIIGQKEIKVVLPSEEIEKPFGEQLFIGSIWVNIVRAFVFLVIWVILFFLLFVLPRMIANSDGLLDKRSQRLLKQIREDIEIPEMMKSDYINNYEDNFQIANRLCIAGDERITRLYKEAVDYVSSHNVKARDYFEYKEFVDNMNEMIKKGYVVDSGGGQLFIPPKVSKSIERIKRMYENNKLDFYFLEQASWLRLL